MLPYCIRRTAASPSTFQRLCREASTRARRLKKAGLVEHTQLSNNARAASLKLRKENRILEQRLESYEDGTSDVNWFEQDVVTGERHKVDEDPGEKERKELEQELRSVQKELRKYDTGSEGELDEAMLELLSPEDRAKVLAAQEEEKQKNALVLEGLLIEVPANVDRQHEPHLRRLNRYLRNAALNPHVQSLRSQLLVAHKRARNNVPGYLQMLSEKAWHTMWELLPFNLIRQSRPLILSFTDDIVQSGHTLSVQQQCARVEVLWLHGERAKAYNELKHLDTYMQADSAKPYEVIIKMCAEIGHLDRALSTFRQLFLRFPQSDPRIALPLMFSLLKAKRGKEAFALYLLMRSQLGSEMSIEDYDKVTLIFLTNGYKDLALAAFRDMALHSVPIDERNITMSESRAKYSTEYQSVLHRVASFQQFGTSAEEVNRISLASMTALPKVWQNKFFYAQWLKKLIGMDQLDAAAQVVELMYERGCKPDARHINGVVGALFRRNDPESVKRGEQLGWLMINERMAFRHKKRAEQGHLRHDVAASEQLSATQQNSQSGYASLEDALNALSVVRTEDAPNTLLDNGTATEGSYLSDHVASHGDRSAERTIDEEEDITLSDQALSFGDVSKAKAEIKRVQETDFVAPLWQTRLVPPATLETFNVLLLHYLVRGQYHMMYVLRRLLDAAEIQPDIYFINQLIYAGLYDENYTTGTLWQRYHHLIRCGTDDVKIQPDMGTFEALWDAEIRHMHGTRHDKIKRRKFPGPRALFKYMVTWAQQRKHHRRDDGLKVDDRHLVPNGFYFDIPANICIQILQCFSYVQDVAGLLVVIHALRLLFNVEPGPLGEDALCTGIASMPISKQGLLRGRRRYLQQSADATALANVEGLLQELKRKRSESSKASGRSPTDPQGANPRGSDSSLPALSDLLRTVLRKLSGSAEGEQRAIEEAMNDIGLAGLDLGE